MSIGASGKLVETFAGEEGEISSKDVFDVIRQTDDYKSNKDGFKDRVM